MKYEDEGGVSHALLTELNVREVTPELALGFLQSPPCSVQRVLTNTAEFNAVPLASATPYIVYNFPFLVIQKRLMFNFFFFTFSTL